MMGGTWPNVILGADLVYDPGKCDGKRLTFDLYVDNQAIAKFLEDLELRKHGR